MARGSCGASCKPDSGRHHRCKGSAIVSVSGQEGLQQSLELLQRELQPAQVHVDALHAGAALEVGLQRRQPLQRHRLEQGQGDELPLMVLWGSPCTVSTSWHTLAMHWPGRQHGTLRESRAECTWKVEMSMRRCSSAAERSAATCMSASTAGRARAMALSRAARLTYSHQIRGLHSPQKTVFTKERRRGSKHASGLLAIGGWPPLLCR